uniref:Phosphoenolpyruvate carboxylase n=1 Tax=Rhizophora mucronata TaxID=61149 RepID=A0A2P2N1S1_RHIMU
MLLPNTWNLVHIESGQKSAGRNGFCMSSGASAHCLALTSQKQKKLLMCWIHFM